MAEEEHAVNITRIVLAIIFLVVIGTTLLVFMGNVNESRQAQGSAYRLQEAIDNVYTHAFELSDPDYAELVNITLPQGSPVKFGVLVDDPKWLIWSGYSPQDIHVLQETKDAFSPHRSSFCTNLCVAFAERKDRVEIPLKSSGVGVHKLWILSPCKATVKVYYDGGDKIIKIGFVEDLDPGNKYNFCCSKEGDASLGHDWPEEGSAFQDGCYKS